VDRSDFRSQDIGETNPILEMIKNTANNLAKEGATGVNRCRFIFLRPSKVMIFCLKLFLAIIGEVFYKKIKFFVSKFVERSI
jgi:hypothetical protein